jgi:hypothetical protein
MKLITKDIEEAIKNTPYGSTENVELDDKKVIARFFNPTGAGTWYVLENDDWENGRVVFGAATLGYGLELGSISIDELESLKLPLGLTIERDISVEPFKSTLGELRKAHGEDWM